MASTERETTGDRDEAGSRRAGGIREIPGRLSLIGDAVMIRHTLFSLPFAVAAVLLATGGRPPPGRTLLVLLAAASARNAANAVNRIVDRFIDARNPRTSGRHIPSGRLRAADLGWFGAAMLLLFTGSTALLGPLCLALLPLAVFLILGYSYTKRFTWLCHAWLGVTCSAATMGAFIAMTGRFEPGYFLLTGAVAAWVCGFDIVYAVQDIEVDRAQGLRSFPARFGARAAGYAAAACHLVTVSGLALAPLFWPELGAAYLATVAVVFFLLAAEHLVARGGTERHFRIAAYSINEIVPIIFLFGIACELYVI